MVKLIFLFVSVDGIFFVFWRIAGKKVIITQLTRFHAQLPYTFYFYYGKLERKDPFAHQNHACIQEENSVTAVCFSSLSQLWTCYPAVEYTESKVPFAEHLELSPFSCGCSPGVGQRIALQVLPILLNFCFPISLLWSMRIVSDLHWWQRMALSKQSTWNQMALVSPAARRLMSWNFSDASTGLRQLPNCLCAPAYCGESGKHHCAHTSCSVLAVCHLDTS